MAAPLRNASDAELLDSHSTAVVDVVDVASPSVVKLEVEGKWSGSGFLFTADGLLVTNSHVIHGASQVRVSFTDGRTARGEVLGEDPDTDVAVVRVAGNQLPHVAFGDSDRVRVGQIAIA